MSRYNKALVAALIAVLVVVVQAVQAQGADGKWTTEDTIVVILAFLGAVGVYVTPNNPPAGQPSRPDMSERG